MAMANASSPPPYSAKSAALRIVFTYTCLAAAWILFSDKLVTLLTKDQATMTTLSIFKGWLFVVVTGIILYRLIYKNLAKQEKTRREIAASEEKLRLFIEHAPAALAMFDREMRYLESSRRWQNDYSLGEHNLLGVSYYEVLPQVSDAWKEAHRRGLAGEVLRSEGDRFERADGSVQWIRWEIRPWHDSAGGVGGIVIFSEDISELKQAEETLHRYKFLADNSRDIILLIQHHDGLIVEANAAASKAYGYDRNELTSMTIQDLRSADTVELTAGQMAESSTTGLLFETIHRRKNGSVFPVEVSAQGATIGGTRMLISVIRDITDRKNIETYRNMGRDILRALNDQADLKEAIREIISIVRQVADVDAVGIRLQNGEDFPYFDQEGFSQVFMQKEHSVLRRDRDGGICRDESGNVCLECTCGLVLTGTTDPANPLFTKGGSAWTNDSLPFLQIPSDQDPRTNPRDECTHQGFASIALIPIRAKGGIVGLMQLNDHRKNRFTSSVIKTLEDIADNIGEAMLRKQAESELRKSTDLILNLLQSTDQGIYGVTLDGCCTFINRAALTMLGYNANDCLGKNMHNLIHHSHGNGLPCPAEDCPISKAWALGEGYHVDSKLLWRSDGTRFFVEYSSYPIVENGVLSGAVVTFSDISARIHAEEERNRLESQLHQAQKMESIGCLAGGVAHDFNNKLSVILGHTELALMQSIPEQVRNSLEEILSAANQSADLTRQLLAFARKQTIEPKVLDLNDVIVSMLKMLQRLIGEDIHLAWLPARTLYPVSADRSQIDQIMANLCVNARDAIADVGKITIETKNRTFDDAYCAINPGFTSGDYVEIAVSDNGCGMDKETQAHVFEPFFTTKAVGKGTGLGLATIYGIVKQNRGFINLYSEPGHGTTFKIYLPRHEGEESPAQTKTAVKQYLKGRETILLVEDEPSILKMTASLLETQGYNLLAADSPDKAIELANEYRGGIQLLLTDVVMPGMNGRDLAKRLQELHPQLKCLYMSGYTANVIAHHGVLDAGVYFIQKPFSLPDLTVKLRDVLDGT